HQSTTIPDLHSFPTRRSSDLVHKPTLLIGIVVPEVKNRSCRMMLTVWIEESSALRSVCVGHFDIRATGLNGEIKRHRDSSWQREDRKSTRLNSSHVSISYAVF